MSPAEAEAIVVAYRSADVIGKCLQALGADPVVNGIHVVNNSPGDQVEAIARRHGARYGEPGGNVGYGRAVNSARPGVSSEHVVLANPDAVASDGCVSALVRFLDAHPKAALVAPQMRNARGGIYKNSQRRTSLPRMVAEALRVGDGQARPEADHLREHAAHYVIGSFVVCRRLALDQIGWFDESIFLFGEDQDMCRRLQSAGWEVWFTPQAVVTHAGGHSWRQLDDVGRVHFQAARQRELAAERGRAQAFTYRTLLKAVRR